MENADEPWPWIAQIARDLELHSEQTIQVAIRSQAGEPQRPIDAFLTFGQAARETVVDYLEQDRDVFVGQVADDAFARWGLAEGKFDEATLGRVRKVQESQPRGPRLWEVLEKEDGLGLAPGKELAEYSCPMCRVAFELPRELLPHVVGCPGCGVRRDTGAITFEDVDTPSGPLEAQLWLADEAFARWAMEMHGVDPDAMAAARKKTGVMALFEVLVQESLLKLSDAMDGLRAEVALSCEGCRTGYQLGAALLPQLAEIPCPLCQGSIEKVRGEVGVDPKDSMDPTQAFKMIGPYRLVRRLGEGGMGNIYVAEDPQGTRVALKTVSLVMSDPVSLRRFEREGVVLSRLRHPNIVGHLGAGVDAETQRPWIALELVEGRDLAELLADRPSGRLTLEEAVFVVERLSRALIYAHDKGVIHRDVKPENVLVTSNGEIRLTDFGIALSEDASARITAKNEVLGTPIYVAPEVLAGSEWSDKGDVYSLGVLCHRCLSGKAPFAGPTPAAIMEAKNSAEAPRLRDDIPEIPAPFSELVARMLDKDPAKRPTAEEFGVLLSEVCQDTTRPSALKRLWKEAAKGGEDNSTAPASDMGTVTKLIPDQRFHHYRIDEEIGRGGMGVVYRAQHLGLKRTVALKVLMGGALASDEERRRFLREAEAAGAVRHPNIVPILDAGEHDGTYFLTMEHVKGVPLNDYALEIDDERKLLELFCTVCDGVHHAHSRGIIHRDLKPENILVDDEGMPRILDFGIAKRLDEQQDSKAAALTSEGDILGTLRYMPPEQAAGQIQDVDIRSDVYALGSILYELVCGVTPFAGSMREILHQLHFTEARAPSVNKDDVPWELDAICLKALEKERDGRYQSALELKQDVERYLAAEPIRARPVTPWYRLRKWASRNRRQAMAIVAGAAVVLLAIAVSGYMVVVAEANRRAAVVESSTKAWELYGMHDFQGASDEFRTARQTAKVDDVLPLPAVVVESMPEEVILALGSDERSQPRVTIDRLESWAKLASGRASHDKASQLVAEAREAYEGGRIEDASRVLQLGISVDPDHRALRELAKRVSKDMVTIANNWLQAAKNANNRAERRPAVERARLAAEDAQRLDKTSRVALDVVFAAAAEIGKLDELDQAAALRQRNVARAIELVSQGDFRLREGKLAEARRSYDQALAFDGSSTAAKQGLVMVERGEEKRRREEERRQTQAKVESMVKLGRSALDGGDIKAARSYFTQAIAFDGASEAARTGLVEVDRIEQNRAQYEDQKRKERLAATLLAEARRRFEEGRILFRQRDLDENVRERYFVALETLQQALFVVPEDPAAIQMLKEVGREFSAVLVDQGHVELSRFIMRLARVDPNETTDIKLPHDPYLTIVEKDRVNIRRAFGGGVVRFEPTRAFDPLRDYLREKQRFRVVLGLISEVKRRAKHHPQIFVRGFELRLEDKLHQTISPPLRLSVVEGDFERGVQVDGQGRRLVRSLEKVAGFDVKRYVREVTELVRAEIKKRGQ